MEPYAPRPIRFAGVHTQAGWRIKTYRITYGPAPFDEHRFAPGAALALAALPAPAVTPERAGVGFLIAHQGRGTDYLVLGWWDRENELPLRIWLGDRPAEAAWRPARGAESFCVWDLQVLWHEREAYVGTVRGGAGAGGADAYLSRVLEAPVPPHAARTALVAGSA